MPGKEANIPTRIMSEEEEAMGGGIENPDDSVSDSNSSDDNSSSDSQRDDMPEHLKTEQITESPFLDEIIIRLMTAPVLPDTKAVKTLKKRVEYAHIVSVNLEFEELERLCDMAITSFMKQSSLLIIERSQLPVTIVGDVHGQFKDLRGIFHRCGPPYKHSYLFLGDFVDRGIQGIEVFSLLIALKIKYPNKMWLLRGNHEDANTSSSYGFYDECLQRFTESPQKGERIWKKFIQVFNCIPLAAVVNKSIFCCHGGLSPDLDSLDSIARISRPSIIPPYGLLCDLVWSDPSRQHEGWTTNVRGISLQFSEHVVKSFCQRHKIDLVVRGHQLTRDMLSTGYEFFAKGHLLTLFSAPNYLNMRNASSVLNVSKKMRCRFVVFRVYRRPTAKSKKH